MQYAISNLTSGTHTQQKGTSIRLPLIVCIPGGTNCAYQEGQLRPTYVSTLVDRTVLCAAKAANFRYFGLGLDGGDDWQHLRDLGREDRVVFDRERSVEGSNDSTIRGVREKVC